MWVLIPPTPFLFCGKHRLIKETSGQDCRVLLLKTNIDRPMGIDDPLGPYYRLWSQDRKLILLLLQIIYLSMFREDISFFFIASEFPENWIGVSELFISVSICLCLRVQGKWVTKSGSPPKRKIPCTPLQNSVETTGLNPSLWWQWISIGMIKETSEQDRRVWWLKTNIE